MNIDAPKFPTDMAFKHNFDAFGDAYLGIDWICPAFNFAVALSQMSIAMGKKYVLKHLGNHYPNFYQVILGRSHLAAKSPTLDRAAEGVDFLKRNVDPPEMINHITEINSAPGLREEFSTHDNGDANTPSPWFYPGNGVRGFITFDELASLLTKSRNSSTEGIPVELTRIYNPSNSPLENNTRQNKSYGEDWVVNIFGCSTLTWYERFITQGDFSSGFLNRFVFYIHEQQPIKSSFDNVDLGSLGLWQKILTSVMQDSIGLGRIKEYTLSDEAFESFDSWYKKIMDYLIEDPDDIKREASARIVSQVLKLSLVYAVLSNVPDNHQVSLESFESAKAVGSYWGKCMGATLDEIEFTRMSKAEKMVMNAVTRVVDTHGECTKRQLRNAINKKSMDSDELNKTLEVLVNADSLIYNETDNGKKIISIPAEGA